MTNISKEIEANVDFNRYIRPEEELTLGPVDTIQQVISLFMWPIKMMPKRMLNRMRRSEKLWKKSGNVEERYIEATLEQEAKRGPGVPGQWWARVGGGRVVRRAGGGDGRRWIRVGLVGVGEGQGWRTKRWMPVDTGQMKDHWTWNCRRVWNRKTSKTYFGKFRRSEE